MREAIILHEQPDKARTIIEKFTDHANVAFAVAIFSADDFGYSKEQPDKISPRARQNVVFEFGYFVGKLGRGRAFALTQDGVELPSDYDGVIYIPLDSHGAWKMKLVRELREAGIAVDANRVL